MNCCKLGLTILAGLTMAACGSNGTSDPGPRGNLIEKPTVFAHLSTATINRRTSVALPLPLTEKVPTNRRFYEVVFGEPTIR